MRRILSLLLSFVVIALGVLFAIPAVARSRYGDSALSGIQGFQYAAKILYYDSTIRLPADPFGAEKIFEIHEDESPYNIAARLEEESLILDDAAFITLLVYTGADAKLLPGRYSLSPAYSMQQISGILQDAAASQVTFVILPGWRKEEIAASLATSGLLVAEETFLHLAQRTPPPRIVDAREATESEGFLFPDTYLLARDLTADQLLNEFMLNFARHLSPEIKAGFAAQGLSVYDAVKLASIVEREAIVASEQKLIASVYLNRLHEDQKLEADPTVQYALGFAQNWWKAPLSYADLEIASPYNTYLYAGLPPTPICNPSQSALEAVAFPAQSNYFYFRARCDGSGLHAFAETFAEHLANGCDE